MRIIVFAHIKRLLANTTATTTDSTTAATLLLSFPKREHWAWFSLCRHLRNVTFTFDNVKKCVSNLQNDTNHSWKNETQFDIFFAALCLQTNGQVYRTTQVGPCTTVSKCLRI